MEAVKILEKKENLDWDYDEEGDVLYISNKYYETPKGNWNRCWLRDNFSFQRRN